jgi:phage-related protein
VSDFNYIPDYESAIETKPRLIKAQFGDGYRQTAADGLNHMQRKWQLQFERKLAEVNSIEAFLRTKGGYTSFTWTAPDTVEYRVVCEEWAIGYVNFNRAVLTAVFEETKL